MVRVEPFLVREVGGDEEDPVRDEPHRTEGLPVLLVHHPERGERGDVLRADLALGVARVQGDVEEEEPGSARRAARRPAGGAGAPAARPCAEHIARGAEHVLDSVPRVAGAREERTHRRGGRTISRWCLGLGRHAPDRTPTRRRDHVALALAHPGREEQRADDSRAEDAGGDERLARADRRRDRPVSAKEIGIRLSDIIQSNGETRPSSSRGTRLWMSVIQRTSPTVAPTPRIIEAITICQSAVAIPNTAMSPIATVQATYMTVSWRRGRPRRPMTIAPRIDPTPTAASAMPKSFELPPSRS